MATEPSPEVLLSETVSMSEITERLMNRGWSWTASYRALTDGRGHYYTCREGRTGVYHLQLSERSPAELAAAAPTARKPSIPTRRPVRRDPFPYGHAGRGCPND